jgi:TatD DNase family protein
MIVFDCHAHLEDLPDLPAALARAAAAGVETVLAVAVSSSACRRVLEISRRFSSPRILPALGLYPAEASEEELARVVSLIEDRHSDLAAIGEIGMDYWIPAARAAGAARSLQRRVFREMLALSRRLALAPVIHSRGSWADCLKMVKESGVARAVFHWYSGPADVLQDLLASGHFVSASPAAEGSPPHRAALAAAPLERIVLETDCPVPRRVGEKRIPTEPADVLHSLRAVAELKGVSEEEAARVTTATARSLFCGSPNL